MGLLNEDVAYVDLATSQSQDVFLPDAIPSRELLHTGTRLCFFAPTPTAVASTHQWWILLNPLLLSNNRTVPGIGEFLYRSGCRIDHNFRLIAPEGVKVCCAEPQSRFVLVSLTKPVYGYVGETRTHRPEPNGGALPVAGGEFRVWIPGLCAQHIQRLPIPRELQYIVAEPEDKPQDRDTEETQEESA